MAHISLWQGDCLEIMKNIPDKSIDMILCDPPYGINFQSNFRKILYDKIKNDSQLDWLEDFLSECSRILKDNTAIYCFCSWQNIDIFKVSFEKYFKLKNIIIWVKNNHEMGDLKASYAPKHEFILYGNKRRSFLREGRKPDIIYADKTGNKLHPTQKPVVLLEFLIKNSSDENDIILDCFMGFGSTGVACAIPIEILLALSLMRIILISPKKDLKIKGVKINESIDCV